MRPSAAWLPQDLEICLGDRVWVERAVRTIRRIEAPRAAYPTVDDKMRDVNALRAEFAGRALGEAAQRELAHRKCRRVAVTLDAGAGAGQQDRALAAGDHAAGRLLDDEKPAERRDLDGHANGLRIKLG